MTDGQENRAGHTPGPAQVPLSALEHHDYCPRQAGLILLEDGYSPRTAGATTVTAVPDTGHCLLRSSLAADGERHSSRPAKIAFCSISI